MTTEHWWNISKGNRSIRRNLCPRITFSAANLAVFIGPATQTPKQCFILGYNFFFPHRLQFTIHYNNPIIRLWKIWAWLHKPHALAMTGTLLSWFIAIIPSSH